MSDQSTMSRREALIAATAVTSIAVASVANADKPGSIPADDKAPSVTLSVTLTDGQLVQLKATQVVIDFGGDGKLLVKSSGIMPVAANLRNPKESKPRNPEEDMFNEKPAAR
ncbi:MAG: hypothetical protein JWP89_206 [Schlesneria sp.]|nr:hypothetical protein [Schlesneria sp.]